MGTQVGLWEVQLPNCYFKPLLENGDTHCLDIDPKQKNEVFSCENPKTYEILAHIRGLSFDVIAKPIPTIYLPTYIPGIPSGSNKIIQNNKLPFVAVTLGDIISKKELNLAKDIRSRIGLGLETKIIVLCYGQDDLIEKIWPKRHDIFKELSNLGIYLISAINYSVWFTDPHAERIINPKRSILTFEEMQTLGLPAIPIIYWTGRKDLCRWLEWLNNNRVVDMIAFNLQTERDNNFWLQTLKDFEFFVSRAPQTFHYLVTGPITPKRIRQIKEIIPSFTLTNSYAAQMAWSSHLIKENKGEIIEAYSGSPKNEIFSQNIKFYENILKENNTVFNSDPQFRFLQM